MLRTYSLASLHYLLLSLLSDTTVKDLRSGARRKCKKTGRTCPLCCSQDADIGGLARQFLVDNETFLDGIKLKKTNRAGLLWFNDLNNYKKTTIWSQTRVKAREGGSITVKT